MYIDLPIPTSKAPWQRAEILRLRGWIFGDEKSYEKNGVRYWKSNDRVIPPSSFVDAYLVCPTAQSIAHDISLDAFCRAYRAQQAAEPSAEERYEARAAHGPGVVLVDIISGRRFTT